MGIDPGLTTIGYAFVEKNHLGTYALEYGIVTSDPLLPEHERLNGIAADFKELIERNPPDHAAVEIFIGYGIPKVVAIAQARGVILATLAAAGVPLFYYQPTAIKIATCPEGKAAKKKHVRAAMDEEFQLHGQARIDDANDALAIAVTHMRAEFL
jgi:crossover junction endodeoxyribonuclease RuvC